MGKRRASASLNSEVIHQLCDLVVPKLAKKMMGNLLPKQRVVSSNLITRSSFNNVVLGFRVSVSRAKVRSNKFIVKFELNPKWDFRESEKVSYLKG